MTVSVETHFEGKAPQVRATYEHLLTSLRLFGQVAESPKGGSIHLDNESGFAGVYTRKDYILLHFRTDYKIDHPRMTKVEQLSARRFKHTVQLRQPSDVDAELLAWLNDAYKLAGKNE
jgi:hypothetical protein